MTGLQNSPEGDRERARIQEVRAAGGLLYAGKTAAEMTRDELAAAALHFRDAHVESHVRMTAMLRRMKKLEEAVGPEKVKVLDKWLAAHAQDALRGDGAELYAGWQKGFT